AQNGEKEGGPSILDGVPAALPALLRAQRLQGKAARVGFDWADAQGPLKKVEEEWAELQRAIAAEDAPALERELGDFLFAAVNLARKLRVDAEQAAQGAVGRFTARFHHIEAELRARGLSPEQVPLEELDRLWEEAKAREAGPSPA
ncbi:MAG: MazG nucleotide pyrophosphohydrolase domain-containing protein, partial [Nitrospinota bacterium]